MNFNRKLFQIVFRIGLVLAPIAFALRLLVYWYDLDPQTGFFVGQGIYCTAYNVIALLLFFACLFFAFWNRGEKTAANAASAPDREEEETDVLLWMQETEEEAPRHRKNPPDTAKETLPPKESSPEDLPTFSANAAFWHGLLSAFSTFLPGFGFFGYAAALVVKPDLVSDVPNKIYILLSVLSGIFFLFAAVNNGKRKDTFRAYFAMVPALWCTMRLVMEYRDLSRYVNKGVYIAQFLFVISALLFFVYYAQLLLGEKALFHPNAFSFFSLLPAFFGLTGRLPQIVALLGDRITMDPTDAATLLIDLALAFFIAIKIKGNLQKN